MRSLLWQSDAWKEYTEIQSDKALLKRVNNLIKDVMRNGYNASYGQVEMLKGDFAGWLNWAATKRAAFFYAEKSSRRKINFAALFIFGRD